VSSRLDTNSLPFSILPQSPREAGETEPPSVLANDLRLTCNPRKVSPGRLAHLLQLAHRAIRADKAGIGLLSAEGTLVEHLTVGIDRDETVRLERLDSFQALLAAVMRRPAPTRVAQLALEGLSNENAVAVPFLGVPLHCAGRSRGVLYLMRNVGEAEFTHEDEELLGPVGTWLEQANLSEEARLLNRLRLLNQVAHAAAGNLDMRSILAVSVRELDRLLPLHVNAVWLVEDNDEYRSVAEPTAGSEESATQATPTYLRVGASTVSAQSTKLGIAPGIRIQAEQVEFARCLRDGAAFYADMEALVQEEPSPAAARVRTLADGDGSS
jgi:GAF domain-containing protein